MERAVYFDAWFHRQHNYHPSLPPRRLRHLDDLVDYRATMLVWSALGGGSIGLPYLEGERDGQVPERYRYYGFLTDREFIEECHKREIKVFGVVFECQGWEYPVELNDAEDTVLAMNELRGAGTRGWLGLREFSSDRYPKLWPAFERYFPGGLRNSAGELVTDLLAECTTRDVHGEPCHSRWVEYPDREAYCYNMDRNNPVWREYLKAIVRLQIDAGVDGIHLDEAETPLTALPDGGCFCRDCMAGFRAYLTTVPPAELPDDVRSVDLSSFDYAAYLLSHGHDFKSNREQAPLYWQYLRYQHGVTPRYFGEIADYARSYAAERGRTVLICGNFFECLPRYYGYEPKVDAIVTEMATTGYRQPAWCRYVAGFAGDKPAVSVENPYGGVGPELLPRLQHGKSFDQFRMMIYEGAAMGIDASLPYGAWMGSVIQDAFYVPHELAVEIGSFLADNERLYGTKTANEIAVAFSTESAFLEAQRIAAADAAAGPASLGPGVSSGRDERAVFWRSASALVEARQPFDVVMFADGETHPDELTQSRLSRYRSLVLPACLWLTEGQMTAIEGFAAGGGRIVVVGPFAENVDPERRARLLGSDGVVAIDSPDRLFAPESIEQLFGGLQVRLSDPALDCAVNLQAVDGGVALHVIRYDYDEATDAVSVLPELTVTLRLTGAVSSAEAFSPAATFAATLESSAVGETVLRLRNVPIYSVVLLSR